VSIRSSIRASIRCWCALLASCALLPLGAVMAQSTEPSRPQLAAGSDPKHWEPYFDVGERIFKQTPMGAEAAFYWASKLDPTRAEPLFARYAAFFTRTKQEDVRGYFRGDEEVLRRPEILRADSLRVLALMRNPFVHRGLEILIFDRLPGGFADDRDTRAWIAYSNGEFPKAVDLHTRTIERDGRNARWRRFDRALAYVALGDNRSALADLTALLTDLRAADERGAVSFYTSKHFLLYMIGMLHTGMRDYAAARSAFQEALLEDASFAYGNAGLGALSRLQRNHAQAADEYALAVELAPTDAVLRFRRVEVLFDLQRFMEAERELLRVIAEEPYWPAPHHLLGRIRERQGKEAEAYEAWAKFVAMAPANDAQARAIKVRLDARAQRAP
jgi:tetratricopeptide (TPR) repeat protein